MTLVALAWAGSAAAEPRDKAAADALFRAAREEFDRGSFASACEKFAESNRLDPAPGTVLNLSVCLEKIGRVASGWEGFRQVAEQLRDERVAFANERSQKLEGRLPWLTLRLAAGVPKEARVFRDGVELQSPSLGVALPVDPGTHTITVKLPGHEDGSLDVMLLERERREIKVQAGKAKPAPVRAPAAASARTASQQQPPAPPHDRTLTWIAGGAGVAGLATSLVAGGLALSRKITLDEHCVDQRCDAEGLSAADQGRTFATVSTVAGIVGVVGVGASTWLLLSGSKEFGPETRVDAALLPGGASLTVGRRF